MNCVRSKEMQTQPLVESTLPSEDQISDEHYAAQEMLMLNNEDPQQENKEEEEVVLDPNHPLALKHQSALSQELSRLLERMKLKVHEKRKTEKEDANYSQELSCKLNREQAYQVKLEKKLQDLNTAKAQTVAKHRQVQEQLEANTNQSSAHSEKKDKAEHNVVQLQAELNNLMLLTLYTQEECDTMRLQVKTMKTVRHKKEVENSKAEEEKRMQDLYVDQLTKELNWLTQQKDKHLGKILTLKEETRESNESLLKVNMDLELFLMSRKQLLCQWNNRLLEIQKRDEPLSAKLEAVFEDRHRLILLDEEIEKYKKSIKAQEEQSQTLITELKWYQADCAALKKRTSERQRQQECLQSRYTEKKSILSNTSQIVDALKKDAAKQQDELNDDIKMIDELNSKRLELENKVLACMQQLPYKNTAQHSLIKKMASLMTEKRNQLQLQGSDINAMKLARHDANVMVGTLELTEKDFEEEIRQFNKQLTDFRTDILSKRKLIKQKQVMITDYKQKINEIVASMANEELGPLGEMVRVLMADLEEVEMTLSHDKHLWMELQEKAIKKVLEMEARSREIMILQTENTALQKKTMRLESQVEFEHQVGIEVENTAKKLQQVQAKLNTLLGKNKLSDQELELETTLMERELNQKLQEAYRETLNLQMKYENLQEENEQIMVSLLEVEQHIMLWERKAQIVQETQAAVNSEENKEKISAMKVKVHRREVQLSGLMRRQEELVYESQKTVERWGSNLDRKELKSSIQNKKQQKKTASPLTIMCLQRNIKEAIKLAGDFVKMIKDLQESQTSLSNYLMKQQQQMTKLYNTSSALDSDILKLQDGKDWDSHRLCTMVTREKKLREVIGKKYKVSTTNERVEAALETVTEHLHNVGTISSRVCEEFPQHQEVLHRLVLELAPHTKQ
ncbi:coiled-coil domain-containing protein 40-like [Gouania willdenowi]|uniref:coiled-coil domain-containing protein 40-like n=1 Tax=Gouania willdenowi TaxID=441366 RepID=UPI0010550A9A|nr:coiled-coil domain-containing protein 40-like [Gouania willdenowi]